MIQWFKNGDHPNDNCKLLTGSDGNKFLSEGEVVRRFRNPDVDGQLRCEKCGNKYHYHGWLDKEDITVCPSDYVSIDKNEDGKYEVLSELDKLGSSGLIKYLDWINNKNEKLYRVKSTVKMKLGNVWTEGVAYTGTNYIKGLNTTYIRGLSEFLSKFTPYVIYNDKINQEKNNEIK